MLKVKESRSLRRENFVRMFYIEYVYWVWLLGGR